MAQPVTKRGTRRCNIGSTRKICFRSTIKDSNAFYAQPFRVARHIGISVRRSSFLVSSRDGTRHLSRRFLSRSLPPSRSFSSSCHRCPLEPESFVRLAGKRALNARDVSLIYMLLALLSAPRYVFAIYHHLETPGNGNVCCVHRAK